MKATALERSEHRVGIRAIDLPVGDRTAWLDELIAGGNHDDTRFARHADFCDSSRSQHCGLCRSQARAALKEQTPRLAIDSPGMDVEARRGNYLRGEVCVAVTEGDLLDRDHAVAPPRDDRACHDFDAGVGACGGDWRRAGRLRSRDPEAPAPGGIRGEGEGDTIHRDAIERGLIASRMDRFTQDAADARFERALLCREKRSV